MGRFFDDTQTPTIWVHMIGGLLGTSKRQDEYNMHQHVPMEFETIRILAPVMPSIHREDLESPPLSLPPRLR